MEKEAYEIRADWNFQNRTALVTGSGSGIGQAIAVAFLKAGARVMVNDLNEPLINQTNKLLRPIAGDRVATYWADVRNKSQVEAMVAETERAFGPIDILVNNAATYSDAIIIEMSEEVWDEAMDTNVKGPFLLTQAVARKMIKEGKGGKIINIASGAYRSARRGAAHYCSSKAALAIFTKACALELAEYHINVNSVSPGLIDVKHAIQGSHGNQAYMDALLKTIPMGRPGRPEEIARAVLFLASDDAEYITGEILEVDGGVGQGRYHLPSTTGK
jgi:NAD(P)-dependent dehydrogenase (short-subunit alcohol dehydrogenase family)